MAFDYFRPRLQHKSVAWGVSLEELYDFMAEESLNPKR